MTRRRKAANPKHAVGYARVSTGRQAQHGISLEHQEDAIRAYCHTHGLEMVEMVVDAGQSAYKQPLARRADGRRVCELVRAGQVGTVVALRLDRLFRSIQDCINTTMAWDKAGVALHLLDMGGQAVDTSTPMGRMMMAMMAGFAEMESYAKAERTRDAWAYKRARGQRLGSLPPYGYRMEDGAAVPEPIEQGAIEMIDRLHGQDYSVPAICDTLRREGIPPRGKAWHATTVQRILKRHAAK